MEIPVCEQMQKVWERFEKILRFEAVGDCRAYECVRKIYQSQISFLDKASFSGLRKSLTKSVEEF